MSNSGFSIRVSFRERSYPDEDIASLTLSLDDLGRVEVEPLRLPEAGGTWELWIEAKAIVQAIEAAILYDILKALLSRGIQWIDAKRNRGIIEPELHAVQVSSENVRVAIRTSEGDMPMDLATAERVVNRLPGEFPRDLLVSRDIRVIVLEVAPEGAGEEPRWLIGMGSDQLTHEYNPKLRRFTVISSVDC